MPIPSIGSSRMVANSRAKYRGLLPWFQAMMIRRALEDWCVSESKRAGVPMTPSWTCRLRVAADADAPTAAATQATKTTTQTRCLARNWRDHGRHERHSRGPRRERHVEDLDGPP